MVKIEVDGGSTALEVQGEGSKLSIDICFAINTAVGALRALGKSDQFIRAAFEICMSEDDD